MTNLKYVCYVDCLNVDTLEADKLKVNASVELQATQESCTANTGISFDLNPDTITLELKSYLDDLVTENNVFVADKPGAKAYFVLHAESNLDLSITIAELKRTIGLVTGTISFTELTCPNDGDFCFSVDISNLGLTVDTLVSVNFNAKVIIDFTGGVKREVGLSSSYNLNTVVRILNKQEDATVESTSLGYALAIPAAAIVIAAF